MNTSDHNYQGHNAVENPFLLDDLSIKNEIVPPGILHF